MTRATLLLLAGLTLAACRPPEELPRRTEAEVTAQAKAAAQDAFTELSTALGEALAAGGPTHAIPVCSAMAGELTAEAAARHGVEMVRLSHRPRNPAQRAEGADLAALVAMQTAPAPQVEWEDDGTAVVRLPIVIKIAACLQCHGGPEDIAPATQAALAQRYPDDEATGFAMNELRGIWRIAVPPAPTD